ncbi:MAG TPA: peptidoglycan-binding protein, partial [Stellaceae bacterium]|nr:peptidoglycan-binding protein [Stellaceae bacterium]
MPYLSRHRHRSSTINIWPGFVDALSQLVMVIVFVLLVFTAGQFYLT